MSPPIPPFPHTLRGELAVTHNSHQKRKDRVAQYLRNVLEYRRRSSCCIRFSKGSKCNCALTELLSDETKLDQCAQIVSDIMLLKVGNHAAYDIYVRKQRGRYRKGNYSKSEDDTFMFPEHPNQTCIAPDSSVCLGFWANLMQINRDEWKKYQNGGNSTYTAGGVPLHSWVF
eukprot:scaffold6434_cov80-Skeletonema_marinoi.AAC.2